MKTFVKKIYTSATNRRAVARFKKVLFFLILTLPILFIFSQASAAIHFKVQGDWLMSFGYGMNGKFQGPYRGHTHTGWGTGQDNFEPSSRAHLQLDAIFSDDLSGRIQTEMGQTYWGEKSTGGALGANGKITAIKLAYIDWGIPKTDFMIRMGLQALATPAMASGNSVFSDNMMAVTVRAHLATAFSMTAFWARPYNDNYPGYAKDGLMHYRENYMDNVDAFGLILPMSFDSIYNAMGYVRSIGAKFIQKCSKPQ